MKCVLDASVAVRYSQQEERDRSADAVIERLVSDPESFAVPALFAFEVYSTLFRLHPNPLDVYRAGISPLLSSGILRYPMTDAIAERAARFLPMGLSSYDAVYLAVAEELGGVWLTYDTRAHTLVHAESLSADLGRGLPAAWNEPAS